MGVIAIGLMLKHPPSLVAQPTPAGEIGSSAESFQNKLGELQQAHQNGQTGTQARISSDEVTAALAIANHQPSSAGSVNSPASPSAEVPIRDQQVVFEGDEIKGQFTTQVAGKDIVVTLGGRIGSKDGYVDFVPTSFSIGSMPVPISLVQDQLNKKLLDPVNHEKLRLPEFVSDVKIENGQLVITEK